MNNIKYNFKFDSILPIIEEAPRGNIIISTGDISAPDTEVVFVFKKAKATLREIKAHRSVYFYRPKTDQWYKIHRDEVFAHGNGFVCTCLLSECITPTFEKIERIKPSSKEIAELMVCIIP